MQYINEFISFAMAFLALGTGLWLMSIKTSRVGVLLLAASAWSIAIYYVLWVLKADLHPFQGVLNFIGRTAAIGGAAGYHLSWLAVPTGQKWAILQRINNYSLPFAYFASSALVYGGAYTILPVSINPPLFICLIVLIFVMGCLSVLNFTYGYLHYRERGLARLAAGFGLNYAGGVCLSIGFLGFASLPRLFYGVDIVLLFAGMSFQAFAVLEDGALQNVQPKPIRLPSSASGLYGLALAFAAFTLFIFVYGSPTILALLFIGVVVVALLYYAWRPQPSATLKPAPEAAADEVSAVEEVPAVDEVPAVEQAASVKANGSGPREPLTRAEREVAELLLQPLTNAEIARELNISVHTVKKHVGNIGSKLGVESKTGGKIRAKIVSRLEG